MATIKPGAAAEASADEVLLERLQRDLDGYGPSLHQVVTTSDCLPDYLDGYGPSLHQVVTTSACLPDCLSGRLS